jgi:hypothetical protein
MLPATLSPLVFLALAAPISAFDITMYNSKTCTGGPMHLTLNVADGCSKYGQGIAQAMIMPWKGEQDSEQILVTYSDDNCCHATKIESVSTSTSNVQHRLQS